MLKLIYLPFLLPISFIDTSSPSSLGTTELTVAFFFFKQQQHRSYILRNASFSLLSSLSSLAFRKESLAKAFRSKARNRFSTWNNGALYKGNPLGTWRWNVVVLTSVWCSYVASASVQCHYNVMCLLGKEMRVGLHVSKKNIEACRIKKVTENSIINEILRWLYVTKILNLPFIKNCRYKKTAKYFNFPRMLVYCRNQLQYMWWNLRDDYCHSFVVKTFTKFL